MSMDTHSRILVTGGTGMVGGGVARLLRQRGFQHVLSPTRQELDLLDTGSVDEYFAKQKPEFCFLIAAKVGGIGANVAQPVEFIDENLRMQRNAFAAAHRHKVKKNLFMGSSCIYPRDCPQPIREESLLQGPLEPTNEGYALAKITGIKLAQAYRSQYGMRTVCPMSCNVYGTGDYFNLERAHVLAALVKRFADAHASKAPSVTLWGTGNPRREFIHVDDLARALVLVMEKYDSSEIINVGTGSELSIRELAGLIADKVGYQGRVDWDASKPDGMPRKCMDVSKLTALGFRPEISLSEGVERTLAEYRTLPSRQ
jgi:GDP-L-fucose synthase